MNKIFCEVGMFKCSCCEYETEIYSDQEWLEEDWKSECKLCHSISNKTYEFGVIYRADICEETILHPQCAYLPEHLDCCHKCNKRERIHWTELLVNCPSCTVGDSLGIHTMVFSYYVSGLHFDYFYRQCKDHAKPVSPPLIIVNEKGEKVWDLGSPFTSN